MPKIITEQLNLALKLNPNFYQAYNNRGSTYSDLKQYERAIQLNPNYALAYNNRGLAYRKLKNVIKHSATRKKRKLTSQKLRNSATKAEKHYPPSKKYVAGDFFIEILIRI